MKVAVSGATGTLGRELVKALERRGDTVVALTRDCGRASEILGSSVQAFTWRDPKGVSAPAAALDDMDGVIHLLGEPISQRWTDDAKREINDSRELSTRNLVAGLRELPAARRPSVLISQSGVNFYGPHGDTVVDESMPAGDDFLARVCLAWEAEARAAEELGLRVAVTRTGVVLSESGGALEKMLPPFKLGVGGPIAGGKQYVPWVHVEDVIGALTFCLDATAAAGPINLTSPEPVTNAELSKTLGRVLRRPAFAPVPALAVQAFYGEMAMLVTEGVRAVPRRLTELGYRFRQPQLEAALRSATGKR